LSSAITHYGMLPDLSMSRGSDALMLTQGLNDNVLDAWNPGPG